MLKPNEKAQPVISDTGRKQHLRQNLKYLMDTTIKVLQRIKVEATKFIDHVTSILISPNTNRSLANLQSRKLDTLSITASKIPFDHHKKEQLQNDPAINLKKAILFANSKQLQQVNNQIRNSINKQLNQDDDLQL